MGSTSFPKAEHVSFVPKKFNAEVDIFDIEPQNKKEYGWEKINLKLNNINEKHLDVLTLLFDNFLQIDGSRRFFKIDQYQEIKIPFDIKKKPEILLCLKINNPYTVLEPKPQVLADIDTTIQISYAIIPNNQYSGGRKEIEQAEFQ